MTSTYLSYLTFTRTYGKPLAPVKADEIDPSRSSELEADYFRQNIGKVSSGKELIADERLYAFALRAFGLEDQINNKEFMQNVFDQGVFDTTVEYSREDRLLGKAANPINKLAETFWFSEEFVLPQLKEQAIAKAADNLVNKYSAKNGGLTGPVIAEVNYFTDLVVALRSGEDLVRDDRLFRFVLNALSMEEEYGNKELIAKALNAGVYNPGAGVLKTGAPANASNDSRFNTIARAFAFNEIGDQNTKNATFVDRVVDQYFAETAKIEQREERDAKVRRSAFPAQYTREMEYFKENIGKVGSLDEFLDNDRLYRFALIAFDLESQIPYKGLIKKVLKEGVAEKDALANKLADPKFKVFARALGFAEEGTKNVRNPNFAAEVLENYKRVRVETDAGEDNVGVRLAAYFERRAPVITNWFAVLGDRALREVAFAAFDLPNEMQQTNPDRLVKILESRFDIEDLQDPDKLQKFIKRFTLMYDIRANKDANGGGSPVLQLYGGGGGGGGGSGIISIDPATKGAIF
ncbi:MAG: DUF1217 domain-containing protein [Parvularcula sp.]|jgi:hypothetical protein|nr:DUF1217 domain-containing protein [Parvularcula sp.]